MFSMENFLWMLKLVCIRMLIWKGLLMLLICMWCDVVLVLFLNL